MTLTRADFSTSEPVRVESVEVPGLGDACCIRALTALERDGYDASVFDGVTRNTANLSARLLVLCLCDEDGTLLFPNAAEGARILGDMLTSIIEPLFHKCRKLNGIGTEALEEAVKNFEPTVENASSIDLPEA